MLLTARRRIDLITQLIDISVDIAYILLYCIQLTAVDGVHRGGADFARRYIADRGAIAAFQRDFVFIDSAAAVHIVFDSAVRNSFQLVFGRRLAAGDILCVPGSIGQTADRACTAVDSDLIGRNTPLVPFILILPVLIVPLLPSIVTLLAPLPISTTSFSFSS